MDTSKYLTVITEAVVKRVNVEDDWAFGVVYKLNGTGEEIYVRANHEVIVSAGVIESPAILMRSGIGPKNVLCKTKIPTVKNLPVGNNLQDHTAIALQIIMNNTYQAFDAARDLTTENWKIYNDTGDGKKNLSIIFYKIFL